MIPPFRRVRAIGYFTHCYLGQIYSFEEIKVCKYQLVTWKYLANMCTQRNRQIMCVTFFGVIKCDTTWIKLLPMISPWCLILFRFTIKKYFWQIFLFCGWRSNSSEKICTNYLRKVTGITGPSRYHIKDIGYKNIFFSLENTYLNIRSCVSARLY